MSPPRRSILITGCSEGGIGDALARAFHSKGQHVIASARNPAKMAHFHKLGISTVTMDVLSPESVAEAVKSVSSQTGGSLDMLINNSGVVYSMPIMDTDLAAAHRVFDTNFFGILTVTQGFLPLLRASAHPAGAAVVNQTSVSSIMPIPMGGVYNASKAAAAALTDTLRLELRPWGIAVVELKTGGVKTNSISNQNGGGGNNHPKLPEGSMYAVAREHVEKVLSGEMLTQDATDREVYAEQVASKLLGGNKAPPTQIWRGTGAQLMSFSGYIPGFGSVVESMIWKMGGMDVVDRELKKAGGVAGKPST